MRFGHGSGAAQNASAHSMLHKSIFHREWDAFGKDRSRMMIPRQKCNLNVHACSSLFKQLVRASSMKTNAVHVGLEKGSSSATGINEIHVHAHRV